MKTSSINYTRLQSNNIDKMNAVFQYEGSPITFEDKDGKLMVNATEMAKPFGKQAKDWLKHDQARRVIEAVAARTNVLARNLVIVENGNGTWMHEDVALVFAQWLSTEFYLWCNDHIKELMTRGATSLSSGAYDTKKEISKVEAEFIAANYVAEGLNMNDNSKLVLYNSIKNNYGLTLELPAYTKSEGTLFSATELLKRNGYAISTKAFNTILQSNDIIEQKTRKSHNGMKRFWSLKDSRYGENQVSPHNPKETQSLFYEDEFKELCKSIGLN